MKKFVLVFALIFVAFFANAQTAKKFWCMGCDDGAQADYMLRLASDSDGDNSIKAYGFSTNTGKRGGVMMNYVMDFMEVTKKDAGGYVIELPNEIVFVILSTGGVATDMFMLFKPNMDSALKGFLADYGFKVTGKVSDGNISHNEMVIAVDKYFAKKLNNGTHTLHMKMK